MVFKKRRRKNSRKKYGHRQPISLIRITKIFSKNGKLISQAGPQKQITKEIVKADKARKEQMFEAKKTKIEEHKKIKKLRSSNLPTIPSSLEDELKSNIFLRCDQNDLKIKLNMKNEEDFKVFKKVRDLKDSF